MTENGFEYVDLGLPSGTMWATCNVGAAKPEDEGLLFQFGRTDGYKYGDNDNQFKIAEQNIQDTENKFIPKTASDKIYNEGATLYLNDDAAHVNMGGRWRMPTNDELEELINNAKHEVKNVNEVQGILFTSNINNKHLFVPFAGWWCNGSFYKVRSSANIWSSQIHELYSNTAYVLDCNYNTNPNIYFDARYFAFSVRGVFRK